MRILVVLLLASIALLTSCERDIYRSIEKGRWAHNESFEIKNMAGCCGCWALFVNCYKDRTLTEQFVVETRCKIYQPTKHVFSADKRGKIVGYESFIAVTDSSYTMPVNDIERSCFSKLDSIYSKWTPQRRSRQIIFKEITGFRKGTGAHFPVEVIDTSATKKHRS